MKASCKLILAMLLGAVTARGQATSPQNPSAGAGGQPNAQSGAPSQSSGGMQAGTASAQQKPPSASSGHRVLQAKSADEMKAYQDAASKTDPAQAEAAADAFAAKYPNSELKSALYARTMNLYGQANNAEKVIEVGRKAIAVDPTDPVPLVQVASALVESTRETDMDREQRLVEAAKDAHAAIDNLDTGLMVPPNAPADQVAAVKANILTMAYDALGMVDMNKKDYAAAEQEFAKAIDATKAQPEAVIYLRLSVAQDQLKQYPQALDSANKAVQYAPAGSAAQNLAKQQQARLQKLAAGSTSSAPGSAASPAPGPASSTPVLGKPTTQAPSAPTSPNPPH